MQHCSLNEEFLATDYADLADFNPFNPRNPWLKNSFRALSEQYWSKVSVRRRRKQADRLLQIVVGHRACAVRRCDGFHVEIEQRDVPIQVDTVFWRLGRVYRFVARCRLIG